MFDQLVSDKFECFHYLFPDLCMDIKGRSYSLITSGSRRVNDVDTGSVQFGVAHSCELCVKLVVLRFSLVCRYVFTNRGRGGRGRF